MTDRYRRFFRIKGIKDFLRKVDIDMIHSQTNDVLRSLLQSAQFYTTENGQVLSLESEEFQEASAALKKLRLSLEAKDGAIQVISMRERFYCAV